MESTDLVLWRRWLAGRDGEAFARLVRPELPHALGVARRSGLQVADAEDVVQDCLAELSRVRSERPIRVGLRPWLLRAAWLKARMAMRARARRRRREKRAAAPPPREPADTTDLREEVKALLDELPEADREAVLLRYLHDLDYADVARVLGTTPGAARVRVHRAIERLRERFGGGAGAVVAALPLAAPRSEAALVSAALANGAASGAPLLGGAIAMKIGAKTAVVAVLCAVAGMLAGGGVAALRAPPETAARTGVVPAAPDPGLSREVGDLRAEVAKLEAELAASPEVSAVDSAGVGDAPKRERIDDPRRAELRVRVEDAAKKPLPGREVSIRPDEGPRSFEVTSDAEGIAAANDLRSGRVEVALRFEHGRRTVYLEAKAGWRTEVSLRVPPTGVALSGTVRWWEGPPAGALSVYLEATRGVFHDQFHTNTGADGRFRLEAVPGGSYKVWLGGGRIEYPWRPTFPVTLPDEGAVDREFVVGVPSVRGVIRSAATGDPVAGARISVSRRSGYRDADAGDDGAYTIPDLDSGTYRLHARKEGFVPRILTDITVNRDVPRELDVEIEPAAVVEVVLLEADGEPVTGYVHVGFAGIDNGVNMSYGENASADGRVRIVNLPAGDYEVTGGIGDRKAAPVRKRLVAGQENRVVLHVGGR